MGTLRARWQASVARAAGPGIIAPMPSPTPAAPAEIQAAREAIARIGGVMFARGLTDAAGGNVSARAVDGGGWCLCMTPRYAAHAALWRLVPDDILILEADGTPRSGRGEPSRDAAVHAAIYRAVPAAGAVVHAHAPCCLVFAAAARAIPPRIEAARPLGTAEVVAGGADEARSVASALADAADRVAAFAAAVLVAGHGVIVAGRDLAHAYDGLERLEANARTILLEPLLERSNAAAAAAVL